MRKEVCPIAKEFCREDCGLYDCEKNQCAVLSIVEALENLKEGNQTAMLKQFYKVLSKKYHPDLNPGKDTTAEMQLLNRLKQGWGI